MQKNGRKQKGIGLLVTQRIPLAPRKEEERRLENGQHFEKRPKHHKLC